MEQRHLIKLAETLANHSARSEATISTWCVGHARLFKRLRDGHGCTLKTAQKAFDHLSRVWPSDLEWPSDIPRPKTSKEEAA
jgi:hypothetical protein